MSHFQKDILHAISVFGYFPKLGRVLGLAFGAHFLHNFSMKMFLAEYYINILIDQVLISYFFYLVIIK